MIDRESEATDTDTEAEIANEVRILEGTLSCLPICCVSSSFASQAPTPIGRIFKGIIHFGPTLLADIEQGGTVSENARPILPSASSAWRLGTDASGTIGA